MTTLTDTALTALHLLTELDPVLWSIVGRSLWVSVLATAMACSIGVVLGAWLGVARFTGRDALLTMFNTLLALPSVVVGLLVYLLLSRTALTRQCVEDAERNHGEQLQSLGAKPWLRSVLLAWDERYTLLTVLIAAFGRAISEVGAVMVVGGNIEGFTRVMTTAIALETSKGDLPLALALGLVLMSVVLLLNVLVSALRRWRQRIDGAGADPVQGLLV